MVVNSLFEYTVLLLGWVINNSIWDIITSTGIYLLPLIFKLIGSYLKVREQGVDEGNKGLLSLAWVENSLYFSIIILLFTCIPVLKTDLTVANYSVKDSKTCGYNVMNTHGTAYQSTINLLSGQEPYVPIWWYFVHVIAKGVTQATISSLPCQIDIRQVRFDIQHSKITDPILLEEIQEFGQICFAQSFAKLKASNTSLTAEQVHENTWIGSRYFLNQAGYYDSYHSRSPRSSWPYDSVRDAALPDTGKGGYPTCKQWWNDKNIGISDRVIKNVDPMLWVNYSSFWKSYDDFKNDTLRVLVDTNRLNDGDMYNGYGGSVDTSFGQWITKIIAGIGHVTSGLDQYPMFDSIRESLPMIQSLLFMSIVITLPIITVLSVYDPKTIMTVTFVFFAIIFISFWWELARWLDSFLLDMLYDSKNHSSGSFGQGLQNFSDDRLLGLIIGGMFIILPSFFIGMMAWAGIKIGEIINTAIKLGQEPAAQAGKQGMKSVEKAIDNMKDTVDKAKSALTKI